MDPKSAIQTARELRSSVQRFDCYINNYYLRLHYCLSVVEKPPYEVTETGWGEFEIQIRIYFVDPNEKPITAFHYLRLFQPTIELPSGNQIVCMEFYDEIVILIKNIKWNITIFFTDFPRADCPNVQGTAGKRWKTA